MKKFIIISMMFLIGLSISYASLTAGNNYYWSLDSTNYSSDIGYNLVDLSYGNLTRGAATANDPSKINEGWDFNPLNSKGTFSNWNPGSADWTFTAWANCSTGNTGALIGRQVSGTSYMVARWNDPADDYFYLYFKDVSNKKFNARSTNSIVNTYCDGEYHFYIISRNGNTCEYENWELWIDNTSISMTLVSDDGAGFSCPTADVDSDVGFYSSDTYSWEGNIDEIGIWNRTLTLSERSSLYNYSNGFVLYRNTTGGGGGPPPGPTITYPSITIDKNITNYQSIWLNWSVVGNYTTIVGFLDGTVKFNTTKFSHNFTGLSNLTQYTINLSVVHNQTVYNNTMINLTTEQYYTNLAEIYKEVKVNQALLNDIKEVFRMIGIVLIWAFINIAAFSLLQKGQYLAGWWIYGFASFFDLFLSGYLINTYQSVASGSSFYGLTASFLMVACSVWIIIRVAIPFTYKTYSRR